MIKSFVFSLIGLALFSCKSDIKEKSEMVKEESEKDESSSFVSNQDSSGNSVYNVTYLPTSTTNQIVTHKYYTLSYNEKFEQAEWVAYELKKKISEEQ